MQIMNRALRTMMSTLSRRFPFLGFPLFAYRDVVDVTEPSEGLRKHIESTRYCLRLQRYWWAGCKIAAEASRKKDPEGFVVVDLGCERGWMKRFTRGADRFNWIGLDGNTRHPSLEASGYSEVIECNFGERLPLPDACADVVVSLHVFEHLHDPELAAREVARILKPGGTFLGGTPVAPGPIAAIRTRQLQRRDQAGQNRHWGHVRKFSPGAWRRLCAHAGLGIEFSTGSHVLRCSGSRLENSWLWVRANQLLAGILPSLGQEFYFSARKPVVATAESARRPLPWFFRTPGLAGSGTLAVLVTLILISVFDESSLADEIRMHRDQNDVFVWAASNRQLSKETSHEINGRCNGTLIADTLRLWSESGQDPHFIVDNARLMIMQNDPDAQELWVNAEWYDDHERFLVLSPEPVGPMLRDFLEIERN